MAPVTLPRAPWCYRGALVKCIFTSNRHEPLTSLSKKDTQLSWQRTPLYLKSPVAQHPGGITLRDFVFLPFGLDTPTGQRHFIFQVGFTMLQSLKTYRSNRKKKIYSCLLGPWRPFLLPESWTRDMPGFLKSSWLFVGAVTSSPTLASLSPSHEYLSLALTFPEAFVCWENSRRQQRSPRPGLAHCIQMCLLAVDPAKTAAPKSYYW